MWLFHLTLEAVCKAVAWLSFQPRSVSGNREARGGARWGKGHHGASGHTFTKEACRPVRGMKPGRLKETQWPQQRPLITDRHNKYNTSGEAWTIARVTTKGWPERESGEGAVGEMVPKGWALLVQGCHKPSVCKKQGDQKWDLPVTFLERLTRPSSCIHWCSRPV